MVWAWCSAGDSCIEQQLERAVPGQCPCHCRQLVRAFFAQLRGEDWTAAVVPGQADDMSAACQTGRFVDLVRMVRTTCAVGDEFFREFLEFCQDYEMFYRVGLPDEPQYWLYRLGRMLSHLGHDPYGDRVFSHPENRTDRG